MSQRRQSGDGVCEASILCMIEGKEADLFVLSQAGVQCCALVSDAFDN